MNDLKNALRDSAWFSPVLRLYRQWRKRGSVARQRRFFAPFVQRNSLCFDVGAFRGGRTEIFLQLGARVVAVEPQPAAADSLQRQFNARLPLVVIPKALGPAEGQATLFIASTGYHSSLRRDWLAHVQQYEASRLKTTCPVDVTTLDALIGTYGRPDFVKIDVEGTELDVLRGLHQPVPSLSIEYHLDQLDQTSDCLDYLARFGAFVANYSMEHTLTWGLAAWTSPDRVLHDLVEQHQRGKTSWGDIYLIRDEA